MKLSHFSPTEPRESELSKPPFERAGCVLKPGWNGFVERGGWECGHAPPGIREMLRDAAQPAQPLFAHQPQKEGTEPRLSHLPGSALWFIEAFPGEQFREGSGSRGHPRCRGDQGLQGLVVPFAFLKPELLLILSLTAGTGGELCADLGKGCFEKFGF